METAASEFDAQTLLAFFRALAEESRLKLVGLLAARERNVQELAALLALKEPTVSHHLAILREAGLVTLRADGTTHWYRLDLDELRRKSRDMFGASIEKITIPEGGDVWEREVLRNFLDGERLTSIPVPRKKRLAVFRWFARKFEPGTSYNEGQVNAVLKRHHEDTATIRREMIGNRMFERKSGVYRLRPESEWKAEP